MTSHEKSEPLLSDLHELPNKLVSAEVLVAVIGGSGLYHLENLTFV